MREHLWASAHHRFKQELSSWRVLDLHFSQRCKSLMVMIKTKSNYEKNIKKHQQANAAPAIRINDPMQLHHIIYILFIHSINSANCTYEPTTRKLHGTNQQPLYFPNQHQRTSLFLPLFFLTSVLTFLMILVGRLPLILNPPLLGFQGAQSQRGRFARKCSECHVGHDWSSQRLHPANHDVIS